MSAFIGLRHRTSGCDHWRILTQELTKLLGLVVDCLGPDGENDPYAVPGVGLSSGGVYETEPSGDVPR